MRRNWLVALGFITAATAAPRQILAQACNPVITSARSALAWGPSVPDTNDFKGRVVATRTGLPIVAAYVTVEPGRHVASTDSAGWFQVSALKSGRYDVRVRAVGYGEARDSVTYGFGGLRM